MKPELQPKAGAPYAIGAREYVNRGWDSPLPVPYGSKRLTASGWTGYKGERPDLGQVKAWITDHGTDNIALRMPQDVIGIDVDAYGKKYGDLTLDVWEMTIGPLPATWRSTSRHDSDISGIYWFRLPPEAVGLTWHDLGGDVETISWHHRYAMVWPSIHPETGWTYGWYDENGRKAGEPPRKEDLGLLPIGWVQRLLKPTYEERSAATRDTSGHRDPAHGVRSDALAWIERSLQTLDDLPNPWYEGAFWDQTTFNVACDLVRLANSGWTGYTLEQAEEDLHAHAPTDEGWTRHEVDLKWRSALTAVGDEARPDPVLEDFEPLTAEEQGGSLFDATPVFRHIRQAAHSRGLKAPLVLQNVMARVLLEVPPGWVLPPVVGTEASLNLFFASVGVSSAGKSASLKLAGELLGLTGAEQSRQILPIGTGEGMADAFLDYGSKDAEGMPMLVPNPARLFTADEVETLNQLVDRNGTTLSSLLKSAGTGGSLGQTNAKAGGRNRHVPEGCYRMTMVVNVQPSMAGPLLEGEKSGLPQRFLWMSAEDPEAPRVVADMPEFPGPLDWEMPGDGRPAYVITYPDEVVAQVRQVHLDEQHRADEEGKMEGHLNLTRLKVAEIFALLHGETDITEQWWELAGRFVKESMRTIGLCQEAVLAEAVKENTRKAKASAHAQIVTNETIQEDGFLLEKCRGSIMRILQEEGEMPSWSRVRERLSKKQRLVAERARNALEMAGVIEVSSGRKKGSELITLITE